MENNPYVVLTMQQIVSNKTYFAQEAEAEILEETDWDEPAKDCPICCEAFPPTWMTGMKCGHSFCWLCWKRYLTAKIVDEGADQLIACAAAGCGVLMSFDSIKLLVEDVWVMAEFQHQITSRIVKGNPLMRWCLAPSCEYVIMVQFVDQRLVTCECGKVFCFQCGKEEGDAVPCDLLKRWKDDQRSIGKSELWIKNNTKDCPECSVPIEKYGGCDAVLCTRCMHEFCWLCLEVWGNSAHSCYPIGVLKLFGENHYVNPLSHEDRLNAVISSFQQKNVSWIELHYIKQAVDVWNQCQQTILNITAFSDHLRTNNQTRILVDNLMNLQTVTTKLFECLTEEIQLQALNTWKEKLQNKYRYCEKRLKALLDHEREGYDKGWWDYRD